MLQGRKQLKDLVKKVQAARDEMQWGDEGPPPLLVKIAPDLSRGELEDIAAVHCTKKTKPILYFPSKWLLLHCIDLCRLLLLSAWMGW